MPFVPLPILGSALALVVRYKMDSPRDGPRDGDQGRYVLRDNRHAAAVYIAAAL